MKFDNRLGLSIICIMIIVTISFINVNAEENTEIKEYYPLEIGDFFEYDYDITEFLDAIIEEDEDFDSYDIIDTEFKQTVTGIETINVDGAMLECWIVQYSQTMEYELIGTGNIISNSAEVNSNMRIWVEMENQLSVKSESVDSMIYTTTYSEEYSLESSVQEYETIEKYTYTDLGDPDPLPLKIGKTWSNKVSYIQNTTDKYREKVDSDPFSEWDFTYAETTETIRTNVEIVSQSENVVPAGTFSTLKIKTQEVGESDYDIDFYNKYGILIQGESYVDGALNFMIKLVSYQYTNAEESENGDDKINIFIPILIIGVIFLIMIILIVIIIIVMKIKKKNKDTFVVTTPPPQPAQVIQQRPPEPKPSLPSSPAPIKSCPYCKKELNFPSTPKYCPFCNNQILK